jgi:glycosyltransferase involved in cell wall biosynthesis
MAVALAARGLEVTVASTDADGPDALDVPLDEPVTEDGVIYRYFARTIPGSWKFSWPLTTWLLRNASTFDVVHVHALFSYSTIPGCRGAARRDVPYVLRPLGTLDPWSLKHQGWKKRPYLRLIERSHLAGAAAIHATSESEASAIRALGFGHCLHVIPLGVDGGPTPERVPVAESRPMRMLFMSRLHPVKGLPVLLDAMHRLGQSGPNHAELVIAGSGDPSYERELRQLVESRGLSALVHFAGRVEGEEKRRLLAWADLFVLPSHHENFGIAVAEAMAASLPVLVTEQVAVAQEVAEARAGIVVPLDARSLASAISSLAGDHAALRRMGLQGAKLVRERWTWTRCAESLERLYATLVEPRRRSA